MSQVVRESAERFILRSHTLCSADGQAHSETRLAVLDSRHRSEIGVGERRSFAGNSSQRPRIGVAEKWKNAEGGEREGYIRSLSPPVMMIVFSFTIL